MLRVCALVPLAALWCARATLILQIPTVDGMIVASDSRSMGVGSCDLRQKLMPLDTKPPAVASATGWTLTIDRKTGTGGENLCEAIDRGERDYDLQAVVEKYFMDRAMDRESWAQLPRKLIDSLFLFQMKFPRAASELFQPGNDLYTVVAAFWGGTGLVSANVTIGVTQTHNPYLKRSEWREYTRAEPVHVEAYGDVNAFRNATAAGPLADELKLLQSKRINAVRTGEALGFAWRALDAAAAESRRQTIGGSGEAYAVGPRALRVLVRKTP